MSLWTDPRVVRGMTAQLAMRRARIAAGKRPFGLKLGFGAPAAMDKLKISGPLAGFLMQGAVCPSAGEVSLARWVQPVAEPEIAVRLARDLPAGSDISVAEAAIASLAPAIELADLDLVPSEGNVEAILAGNIYQRHVVLGSDTRSGGDTSDLVAKVFRRGALSVQVEDPEALTGRIAVLLVHLADMLGAFGEKLTADTTVICGSTVPLPLIEPDETQFHYELDPIGGVSVRFLR
jgi:2-keto-4-pentenoate hydratase